MKSVMIKSIILYSLRVDYRIHDTLQFDSDAFAYAFSICFNPDPAF